MDYFYVSAILSTASILFYLAIATVASGLSGTIRADDCVDVIFESSCEAPLQFMGAGWYYCDGQADNGSKAYFAAPGEYLLPSNRKKWGIVFKCYHPPRWKFWADVELTINFYSSNVTHPIGDISLTVLSTSYDAEARQCEADEIFSYQYHHTLIDDADSIAGIINTINGNEAITWRYPDSIYKNKLGIITLPLVLPAVLQKCEIHTR